MRLCDGVYFVYLDEFGSKVSPQKLFYPPGELFYSDRDSPAGAAAEACAVLGRKSFTGYARDIMDDHGRSWA